MFSLLLDLEVMFGIPDGLVAEADLAHRYGHRSLAAAYGCGLVRPFRNESAMPSVLVGLTSRGRIVASHPGGQVHPIELGPAPHEIVAAVLCGAAA